MILQGSGSWSSKLTWGSCVLTVILILCFFSCVSFHTIFLLFLVCHNLLILCRESYVPKILQILKDLYIHLIYNRGINVKCLWYDSLSKLQLYTALRFKGSHNAFHEITEYSYVRVLFKNWRFKGQGWKGMRTWWNFALWQFCSEGLKWRIVYWMWYKCLEGWFSYFYSGGSSGPFLNSIELFKISEMQRNSLIQKEFSKV